MRRLLALVVVLAAAAPLGSAPPSSVASEVFDCYFVTVTVPPNEPEVRVCKPW